MNINTFNNITIVTLNVCGKIKTETDYEHTNIENSLSVMENGKYENDSFSSTNSLLPSSINKETTTFQINDDHNSSCYNEK